MAAVKFGKHARESVYLLDKGYSFTNHGSFSCVPKEIMEKRIALQYELESVPDKWFRYSGEILYNKNIEILAKFLKVGNNQLVLCDNSTESVNAVIKSITFNSKKQVVENGQTITKSNDCILVQEYTYGAVLFAVDYMSTYRLNQSEKLNVVRMPFVLPLVSKEQILAEYQTMLDEIINKRGLNLRLVIVDHISSASAILYPVQDIIKLIRQWTQTTELDDDKRCFILVDGNVFDIYYCVCR